MSAPLLRIEKFSGTVRYPRKKTQPAFYFRIVAANGEIIASSEAYTTARARNATVRLLASARMEVKP
jgi:uncharacterized protein YegP (UPF0339 family)